jgi:hypothetical protein
VIDARAAIEAFVALARNTKSVSADPDDDPPRLPH